MIILGIETATARAGCAIGGVEGVLASMQVTRGRRHAETLVPAIRFACDVAQVSLSEVRVIAVDVGPGLFTGLRVGMATANGLAQGLGLPMIGLSSLDLLAFPLRHTSRLIVTVIDARRGELYVASYRATHGGVQRVGEPRLVTPEALAAELQALGERVLMVGDGAERHASLFSALDGVELAGVGAAHPTAEALVELAHPIAVREEYVSPLAIRPLYLRRSDAELNWERRGA